MAWVKPDYFIITGGPGAGKTSLIDALAKAGYACSPESGRAIIRQQIAIGGTALHGQNASLYAELMLARDIEQFEAQMLADRPVFFDRGIPDLIGYWSLLGLPVPAHFRRAADLYRYAPSVFIAPPWPAIYAHDAERKQSLGEAERTYVAMLEAYPACGYRLIELPRISIGERVRFVRDLVGGPTNDNGAPEGPARR